MKNKSGFTLVEIMIVVMIIGLLAAIALPNFQRARDSAQTTACINNMRQIESGKDQYAVEQGLTTGASITTAQVAPYVKGGYPTCPVAGGTYTPNAIGADVTCSIGDPHVVP